MRQGDRKMAEFEKALAASHDEIVSLKNEIIILRDGMSSYCNRVVQRLEHTLKRLGVPPVATNGETPRT